MKSTTPELASPAPNFCITPQGGRLTYVRYTVHQNRTQRKQSIGQYLSVHKEPSSNPPTNRRLEEAAVVDWPKMMRFKA
ncbi:hypothetical protein AVEN_71157-1 [Araneus ventricosus]|uniref:Uncharacterized protein n=1 Tax=Araneus ventricosus TaxID=182803 RepID=A0A4Y2WVU2_ARAVE|nr:hypothetical protein AVEN_71157-1 [Araneus ventricosus]